MIRTKLARQVALIVMLLMVSCGARDTRPKEQIQAGIEKSMRATFPRFCADPNQKIMADDENGDGIWRVSCIQDIPPHIISIDVNRCKIVREGVSADWAVYYDQTLGSDQDGWYKLAMCP
jgi:hypothetical protein